ncbi:MAG: hypothetical protein ACM3Q2_09100, partial [Syntrophothermus sp.]
PGIMAAKSAKKPVKKAAAKTSTAKKSTAKVITAKKSAAKKPLTAASKTAAKKASEKVKPKKKIEKTKVKEIMKKGTEKKADTKAKKIAAPGTTVKKAETKKTDVKKPAAKKPETVKPAAKAAVPAPEKHHEKPAAAAGGNHHDIIEKGEHHHHTEVIVTSPKKNVRKIKGYSKEDLEYFKKIILDKRNEIIEQLQNLREQMMDPTTGQYVNENSPYSLHMAEQGTDAMEREKIFLWAQRENKFLGYLDDALHRIENGTYGICIECIDEPQNLCPTCPLIAKERLAAVPHSQLCLPVKQKQEKR